MRSRLTNADRTALTRAVEIARRDPKEAEWIDRKMSEGADYWDDIGTPYADQHAAELLKRLLAAGLSRYEPDPLAALDAAERKAAAS